MPAQPVSTPWVLRSLIDGGSRVWNVSVSQLPFRVGRRTGLDLTLPSTSVSTEHAELYETGGELHVRDMGSTNGTYVNRRRVTDEPLRDGDVIHFADFEFRLEEAISSNRETTAVLRDLALPEQFVQGTREMDELLRDKLVTMHFQAIVEMRTGTAVAHEALGRGKHPGLPEGPQELLHIADSIGAAPLLSQMFRQRAVEIARGNPALTSLFLNTHPRELALPSLVESLTDLRRRAPEPALAIEVHESTIVDSAGIREFRTRLKELNIALAYDDFGAGQARLLELADVPPEYLKFDSRFVSGIAEAPDTKQRVVRSLVALARELGARVIAEGIETAADAQVCAQLGFELGQGFYFKRPVLAGEI
jgi:EAL domain-containing protein (putative c-di-GMP-specific phosphodiesterase class I)